MISGCHLSNDMIQILLSAIYPLLQANYGLIFAQIGMITLTFQGTASVLQPMVGFYTDRQPQPYSLAVGMCLTLIVSHSCSFYLVVEEARILPQLTS